MISLKDLLHPLKEEVYKIIIPQVRINEALKKELQKGNPDLKKVSIIASHNRIHLRGIAKKPDDIKITNSEEVHFDITLTKKEVIGSEVIFLIDKFHFYDPKSAIDFLKLASYFSNMVREFVLADITGPSSPLKSEKPYKQLSIDLNFFIQHLPPEANLIGHIHIHNINFQPRSVVLFISSTVVFKGILHLFAPYSIKVEHIDLDNDPVTLLTDSTLRKN